MIDNREALDRHLDDLASHDVSTDHTIDPDLAAAIRRLTEIGSSPLPDPAFVERLEDSLMTTFSASPAMPFPNPRPDRATLRPISRSRDLARLPQRAASRWASMLLAAAMVLVAFSFVSNPMRPVRNWLDDRNQPGGFAINAPATPLPSKETLLRVELPAESMPTGEGINAGLAHFTIPPGTRSTWMGNSTPGVLLEYIVEGSYTVESETPFEVVRAGGEVETITAGVAVTLSSGDARISRNEVAATASNNGVGPVELLSWVLIEEDLGFGGHLLPGWIERRIDVRSLGTVPLAPATVLLERIELAPGESTPGSTEGHHQFAVVVPDDDAGTPTPLVFNPMTSGDIRNVGETSALVYILTFESSGAETGSPAAGTPTS